MCEMLRKLKKTHFQVKKLLVGHKCEFLLKYLLNNLFLHSYTTCCSLLPFKTQCLTHSLLEQGIYKASRVKFSQKVIYFSP